MLELKVFPSKITEIEYQIRMQESWMVGGTSSKLHVLVLQILPDKLLVLNSGY